MMNEDFAPVRKKFAIFLNVQNSYMEGYAIIA